MTKDNIMPAILKLSQSERGTCCAGYLDIVADAPEATVLTKKQEDELDRRLAEIDTDPDIWIDWETALEEIRFGK